MSSTGRPQARAAQEGALHGDLSEHPVERGVTCRLGQGPRLTHQRCGWNPWVETGWDPWVRRSLQFVFWELKGLEMFGACEHGEWLLEFPYISIFHRIGSAVFRPFSGTWLHWGIAIASQRIAGWHWTAKSMTCRSSWTDIQALSPNLDADDDDKNDDEESNRV